MQYFLSPAKIAIKSEIDQSGFMYSSNFQVWTLQTLEEVKEEDVVAVDYTYYVKVHFFKKIPFIGGKIASETIKECKANSIDTFIPMLQLALEGKKLEDYKNGGKSPRASEVPQTYLMKTPSVFTSELDSNSDETTTLR